MTKLMDNVPTIASSDPTEINLASALGALRRHKRMIILTVLLINSTVIAGLHFVQVQYTATATVQVEPAEGPRVFNGTTVAQGLPQWMPGDNSTMATQVNLVRSEALARQVVDTMGLQHDAELTPARIKLKRGLSALVERWLPAGWVHRLSWRTDPSKSEVMHQFMSRLTVQQPETSHVIQVSYTSSTPQRAAEISNVVAEQYIRDQLAEKQRATNDVLRWVIEQSRQQLAELVQAEKAEVEYMAAQGLTAGNSTDRTAGGLAGQELISLQRDLANARADRGVKEAKLAEVRALARQHGDYASLPEVANSPVILELLKREEDVRSQEARMGSTYISNTAIMQRFRAERSALAARIAIETQHIVRNIEDEADLAKRRERALQDLLHTAEQSYALSEQASVQLRTLTRTVEVKQALYNTLLTRAAQIAEQSALMRPDSKLVSAAEIPTDPSFPKSTTIAAAGFVLSLLIGCGLAALSEYRDRSLRTARQAEQALGLTNLGLIPTIKPPHREKPHTYLLRYPQSVYAEAIRSVLFNIQVSRGDHPVKVIMVTSAIPSEGKTTTAMSLGAQSAWSGERTVVVDLDLRHPNVARELGRAVDVGLTEYFGGEFQLSDIVYTDTDEPRLHVIPLRAPVKHAPNVMRSWNMARFVADLRCSYDCIILDLPPSLAINDIRAVVPLADATLFVVRWGRTTHSAARKGLIELDRIGAPVAGMALTQVDLDRHALYGAEDFGEYQKAHLEYFRQ